MSAAAAAAAAAVDPLVEQGVEGMGQHELVAGNVSELRFGGGGACSARCQARARQHRGPVIRLAQNGGLAKAEAEAPPTATAQVPPKEAAAARKALAATRHQPTTLTVVDAFV